MYCFIDQVALLEVIAACVENYRKKPRKGPLGEGAKKLTSVSFMYVCVGRKWSYVIFFSQQ